jgi:hypothetical protein
MTTPFRRATLVITAGLALTLAIATLTMGTTARAAGPTTVNLGSADPFAILAGTPDITSTGASLVNGDVGIHPAAAITGFPPGVINGARHPADAVALQAKNSLTAAYLDAASRPVTSVVAAGTLSGTLVGGVYNSGASILSIAGTVTLDGQGDPSSVWIFQATSSMVIASASRVAFINGAQPCNVFWQVTSSASLGSTADLAGTIMALDSITMANGVTLNGRALARNGTVTLINDNINRTTCATVSTTPAPTFGPTPGPATATPAATAAPSAAPTAAAATATPIGRTPAAATPALRSLPSTATSENDSVFVALAMVGIMFVILYLVTRARRRARNVSA